jgi:hypothetical protein
MHAQTSDLWAQPWHGPNLRLFLFFLIAVVFVLPSLGFERNNIPLYSNVVFSLVLVFGSMIAWENRGLFVLTLSASIAAIGARWMTWWRPTKSLALWTVCLGMAAILMITVVLLWQVFRSGPVTLMRVEGAIAAYLCIGAGWGHAYHLAVLLDPSAFNVAGSDVSLASTWINYSFGMLTTLGYAGIVPVHPLVRTLGSAEAVTGQLYLAVLVARLVSMQVSSTRMEQR